MTLDKQTIQEMRAAGISFVVSFRAPWGGTTVAIEPEEVPLFVQDCDALAAKHLNVTRQQYLDWVEADGSPQCGAVTKRGTRCANAVKGGNHRDIQDWLRLDGGFCVTHGGD
jgi:hypothetical protein